MMVSIKEIQYALSNVLCVLGGVLMIKNQNMDLMNSMLSLFSFMLFTGITQFFTYYTLTRWSLRIQNQARLDFAKHCILSTKKRYVDFTNIRFYNPDLRKYNGIFASFEKEYYTDAWFVLHEHFKLKKINVL
jgi:hypothetical protein